MTIYDLKEYRLLEEREIQEVHSTGYLLKHKKSGARIMVLSNQDKNKVFSIGFRTPPTDSTGLPHILEHSVLCGSKKYPAKDPFVELVKGSLNTFLNAMTYPDKTVYPVASCNDKDFKNLMGVYMDAVLYPNIYKEEKIFRQEGWHYELESKEDPLTISGVVYNEMKGAFSSPEGVLDREILNSLFPDTAYSVESGGDPEKIPDLTYEDFLDFHQKYYHPSNSYIYLYGDMDIIEKLTWLDQEYLGDFDKITVNSEIGYQKPFSEPIEIKKEYSITSTEPLEDNTYLSFNKVIGTSLDKELYLAFQVLEYALLGGPGAPVKQALLDANIGKDIMGSYDNGTYQPIFSIIAKNANVSDKEKFVQVITEVLEKQVEEKVNRNALLAGINYFEFKYKEADYGHYPKGLMFGLEAFDSWLYDESDPFLHMESDDTFAFLKRELDTDYYEIIIQKYLLSNPHMSLVIIEPKQGLTAELDKKLADKLEEYKKSLSEEELDKIIEDTKALKQYQEEPSSKEDMEKIPLLEVADIDKESKPLNNIEKEAEGIKIVHHEIETNGIGYINLMFESKRVPEELIPYLGILKSVLGYVDTKNFSYVDLYNEINLNTGGISNGLGFFASLKTEENYQIKFEVKAKAFYEKQKFVFDIVSEILSTSKINDKKRLKEIIDQLKSRLQMSMSSAGHSIAAMRAMSYFSPVASLNDMTGGISFYREVSRLEAAFEEEFDVLVTKLEALMSYVFKEENLLISYTGTKEGYESLANEVLTLKECLKVSEESTTAFVPKCTPLNEGFKSSAKIQYVSRAGNFVNHGFQYTGALKILKVILSYDYLWNNVRVKGGAYGCMSGFMRTGDSYFASYRDPNLEKTNEIFNNTWEYIKNFDVKDREMAKYIIGTISDIDTPLNPAAEGTRSESSYLNQLTFEEIQKERDEILSATPEDIRKLADLVKSVLDDNCLCVIGNEEKIEENADMFNSVDNLY